MFFLTKLIGLMAKDKKKKPSPILVDGFFV